MKGRILLNLQEIRLANDRYWAGRTLNVLKLNGENVLKVAVAGIDAGLSLYIQTKGSAYWAVYREGSAKVHGKNDNGLEWTVCGKCTRGL